MIYNKIYPIFYNIQLKKKLSCLALNRKPFFCKRDKSLLRTIVVICLPLFILLSTGNNLYNHNT